MRLWFHLLQRNRYPIITPAPLTFRAPIAPEQNATVSELNYGNRTTNPAQVYTLSNGCAGFAQVNPGNPVVPVTSGSGAATLTIVPVVTPMPNGASCNVAVTDNTPQTQNIGVSVGSTYPLYAAGQVAIAFQPGATANMGVSERNYDVPPNGAITANVQTPSGTPAVCDSPTLTGSTLSTDGTYTVNDTVRVRFLTAGICVVQFRDRYNQVANAQVTANPGSMGILDGGMSPSSGNFQQLQVWFNAFVAANGSSGCYDLQGTGVLMGSSCAVGPFIAGAAPTISPVFQIGCPIGSLCLALSTTGTGCTPQTCAPDPIPCPPVGPCHQPPHFNFHMVGVAGPYIQQGVAFTSGQPPQPQGNYHYPLRATGELPGNWCMTNGGPSVAALTANASTWGVPPPAAGYNPSMCYDTSLFDIPGVTYPNMLYNGVGQPKTNLATGTMPTPAPTATPVPTATPAPTPTPRATLPPICTPAMHRLGIC